MSETVDSLILDLLEWIGPGRRPYHETMDAWRTSCPRLPVWEDATDLGFIERHRERGRPPVVTVSASGAEHLRRHRQGHQADGLLARTWARSIAYRLARRPELGPRALRVAAGFGSAGLATAFCRRVVLEVGASSVDAADFGTRSAAADVFGRAGSRSGPGRDLNHAGVISVTSNSTWRWIMAGRSVSGPTGAASGSIGAASSAD